MGRKLIGQILIIGLIIAIVSIMFAPTVQANVQPDVNQLKDTEHDDVALDNATIGTVYISSQQELETIGNNNLNEHFILTEDIEITGNWNPINNFTGVFDGCGHTITFNINETTGPIPSTPYLGLFASCTDATVKNLYVDGEILLTTGGSFFNPNVYAGGIIASATNTTLENVHFSGNINIITSNDNSSWVGGLVGQASNTKITLSSNTASITSEVKSVIGTTRAGGLGGEFSGNIENCYNIGNILTKAATESPYAGGLVGKNKGAVTRSYNSGKVKSEGSGMSLSDVYAGGIVAIGEKDSSVADCAVMCPEISVTIGWVNTGHKYIIANGGNKSNNISINNISGSPTNDSNLQYTQSELKTTKPYKNFDFYNTWAIDGIINNGYPYHYKNFYAINIQYQNVPHDLQSFIEDGYISINDIKQTDDGFTLCTKPLSEILSSMGITEINGSTGKLDMEDLDSWYIYNVGTSYSILKMRGLEERNIGTSIPFMDFEINLINLFHEDLIQQVEQSEYEKQLYDALDKLIYGKVDSDYTYSIPITNYFSTVKSKANYLIAEEYIRKVLINERDESGYIQVPSYIEPLQENFLKTLPDIYDSVNNRIKVKNYNLTNNEKRAILACRTGNLSLNIYAAENIAHAKVTALLGNFLQGTDISIDIGVENEETHEIEYITVQRAVAKDWFLSAIKSDAGIGEESVPKEIIAYHLIASELLLTFGDI